MLLVTAISELDNLRRFEESDGTITKVRWADDSGAVVASGHYGDGATFVQIGRSIFNGMQARTLLRCGKETHENELDSLLVHKNVFEQKIGRACDDCGHSHVGICTRMVFGKKCGCEYVNKN